MGVENVLTSFSFLHAADIHLDSPLRGLSRYGDLPVDEVRSATRAAFDRLIETALERAVDFVVLAGDLYDGDWRDMGTGLYVSAAMGRLGRAGIPVFLLAGNHNAASVITKALPPLENVHIFSMRKATTHFIEHLNVALHGHSFADRKVPENLAADYPDPVPALFHIGLLHTSLGGYAEHPTYALCSTQELVAKGYDYLALGHVHDHTVLHRDPYVVFPGNLQSRNIREQGKKGAVLVEVEDRHVTSLTHLALDVVRWARVEVDASDAVELDDLHGRIRSELRTSWNTLGIEQPLVLRLTLTGQIQLHNLLQDSRVSLRDDIRGLAAEISSQIWLERVEIRTVQPAAAGDIIEGDDISNLLLAPDSSLFEALKADLTIFLSTVMSQEPDSLVRAANLGEWQKIVDVAQAGLRRRLRENS